MMSQVRMSLSREFEKEEDGREEKKLRRVGQILSRQSQY